MGILSRFRDIMAANINALLDKAEDPAKMIDQYLRDLESDLGKVKAETAAVMADETKTKRNLDELLEDSAKLQAYAEKAVAQGNDNDAKQFLIQKKRVDERAADAKKLYDLASSNATKMRSMHDKLVNDIATLNAKRDTIKAKVAAAKTQEKLNQIGSSISGLNDKMSEFDKMEAKADAMLDQANAMAELNNSGLNQEIDELMAKYDGLADATIDDELASIKAKLGM